MPSNDSRDETITLVPIASRVEGSRMVGKAKAHWDDVTVNAPPDLSARAPTDLLEFKIHEVDSPTRLMPQGANRMYSLSFRRTRSLQIVVLTTHYLYTEAPSPRRGPKSLFPRVRVSAPKSQKVKPR